MLTLLHCKRILLDTQLFYEGALDMKWYITNEARSAELVMIILYPASPSRIIVLLKTLRHIIENLKKKSERKERSYRENRKKESFVDQMQ